MFKLIRLHLPMILLLISVMLGLLQDLILIIICLKNDMNYVIFSCKKKTAKLITP